MRIEAGVRPPGSRQRGPASWALTGRGRRRDRVVGAAGDNEGVSNAAVGELAWGTLGSPVGEMSVACSAAGLTQVRFGPPPARTVRAYPGSTSRTTAAKRASDADPGFVGGVRAQPEGTQGEPGDAHRQLERACTQLGEYFAGQRRAFDLPVDWSGMSASQRQVLPVLLASAAYGETVTYGALARRAGVADGGKVPAARVTGQIMGSNPCPIIVPCHRVVAGDGLGGYSGGAGIEIKRWLLIFEGALPPTLDWDAAGPGAG
jgi:methylated-DNA-[protein]-cysteine S-methyltransferase